MCVSQELVKHTVDQQEKENLRTALDAMRVSVCVCLACAIVKQGIERCFGRHSEVHMMKEHASLTVHDGELEKSYQ